MQTHETTTIRGIVVPADWDDQGRILRLAIATYFEDRVLIVADPQGMNLMSCLRKKVTVDGILVQQGAIREIKVQAYALDGASVERRRKKNSA
ncbi:MAG: hypothetical protein V1793_02760 [Pseudomonadota bacterium]